jgi:hypothetical protein
MNSYKNRQEVYLSMNPLAPGARGRTKAEIGDVRHVYLDLDENGTESLKALREREDIPEPNHVLTSSPAKFQVVWRVEGFSKEEAELLMRGMSRATGADIAATDCSRVLRMPGHRNHKYQERWFVTVQNLSDSVYQPRHFPTFDGGEMRTERSSGVTRVRTGVLSQSEHDWAFAMRALSRGESADAIVSAIKARRPDKPSPEKYAARTVEKAQSEYARRSISR